MPVLSAIIVDGRRITVDAEGYLENFDDWNEAVAAELVKHEGLEPLSPAMFDALTFIRSYYKKHHFFPIVNAICKNIHQPKGCVHEEFLNPLVAWKVAGLPKPDEPIISLLKAGQSPG